MALGGSAARRYAEAMLDIATDEGAVAAYRTALEALGGVDRVALAMLRDPGVPLERRLAAATAMTADAPRAVQGLVALLVRRDRIRSLPGIASAYGDLVDEREGIAKARISTAVEVGEAERDGIVRRLEQATGKTIRASFTVDPGLMGGARVQVGDHLVDASLRAQLDALREQLAR